MLDELVVVGYGVQRKSDVATSVASVSLREMMGKRKIVKQKKLLDLKK